MTNGNLLMIQMFKDIKREKFNVWKYYLNGIKKVHQNDILRIENIQCVPVIQLVIIRKQ